MSYNSLSHLIKFILLLVTFPCFVSPAPSGPCLSAECQSDRPVPPSIPLQSLAPAAASPLPYSAYDVQPPHQVSFTNAGPFSVNNAVQGDSFHATRPTHTNDASFHHVASSPYFNGAHPVPSVTPPANHLTHMNSPQAPAASNQPIYYQSSVASASHSVPYYDSSYSPSHPANATHSSHSAPVAHFNPINNYHQPNDVTGTSHSGPSVITHTGGIDPYTNVPQNYESNYTQKLAYNSQQTLKSPTYHDDPSMSSASHFTSQSNSPSSASSYYPMQYNHQHQQQQQMSAPSMQVAHHYSDQPVSHPPQIIPPNAALHTVNGNNYNSNNNGNFNHYYSQPQQLVSGPFHSPGPVNAPNSRYPFNYVHPIAPSNGNIATINRKFDSGAPVLQGSGHSFINLTRPLQSANSPMSSPSTTPKPIELEMSLEDIFRLAQISTMFSNMSFISMDPIASASDAKISMGGSNDAKMIAPIKLPMPSEDGKSDGPIFYGGIFDLSDIEKFKELMKHGQPSTDATVSRRNEESSGHLKNQPSRQMLQQSNEKSSNSKDKGVKNVTKSKKNSIVSDLHSLLSRFIQFVPHGDSSSDTNGQEPGGIEIEFSGNPFATPVDDETDDSKTANDENVGDETGDEEKEKKKVSSSKSTSKRGKKKTKNKNSNKNRSKSSKVTSRLDTSTGDTDRDDEDSQVSDGDDEMATAASSDRSIRRRRVNKKPTGSRDKLDNRSDWSETTTVRPIIFYPPAFSPYGPPGGVNYPYPVASGPVVGGGASFNYPLHQANYGFHNGQSVPNYGGFNYPATYAPLPVKNDGDERDGASNDRDKKRNESKRKMDEIDKSSSDSDVSRNRKKNTGNSSERSRGNNRIKNNNDNTSKDDDNDSKDDSRISSIINLNFPEFFKQSHSTSNILDTLDTDDDEQFKLNNINNSPLRRRVSFGVMANGLVRRAMRSIAYRVFPTMKNVKHIATKGCRDVQSIGSLDSILMPLGLAVTLHPLLLPLVPFFLLALGSIKAVESATCFVSDYFK